RLCGGEGKGEGVRRPARHPDPLTPSLSSAKPGERGKNGEAALLITVISVPEFPPISASHSCPGSRCPPDQRRPGPRPSGQPPRPAGRREPPRISPAVFRPNPDPSRPTRTLGLGVPR